MNVAFAHKMPNRTIPRNKTLFCYCPMSWGFPKPPSAICNRVERDWLDWRAVSRQTAMPAVFRQFPFPAMRIEIEDGERGLL